LQTKWRPGVEPDNWSATDKSVCPTQSDTLRREQAQKLQPPRRPTFSPPFPSEFARRIALRDSFPAQALGFILNYDINPESLQGQIPPRET
jgi:hypothetical protein